MRQSGDQEVLVGIANSTADSDLIIVITEPTIDDMMRSEWTIAILIREEVHVVLYHLDTTIFLMIDDQDLVVKETEDRRNLYQKVKEKLRPKREWCRQDVEMNIHRSEIAMHHQNVNAIIRQDETTLQIETEMLHQNAADQILLGALECHRTARKIFHQDEEEIIRLRGIISLDKIIHSNVKETRHRENSAKLLPNALQSNDHEVYLKIRQNRAS